MSLTWLTSKPTLSFIPKVRREAAQRALNIAENVWQGAVDRTPVASGELRASWNLSRGKVNYSTVGLVDSSPSITGSSLPPPQMPKLSAGSLGSAVYHVSNGKRYAPHVEFGSATITPRLMLTRSIQAARS
jgi:hypothetical protein